MFVYGIKIDISAQYYSCITAAIVCLLRFMDPYPVCLTLHSTNRSPHV